MQASSFAQVVIARVFWLEHEKGGEEGRFVETHARIVRRSRIAFHGS